MAQTSQGVPLHVAHTLQGFQLLELPPELLSLVESGSIRTLHLKSEAVSTDVASPRTDGLAVVCSAEKTFEVRQAQSSNSLYVLQPSSVADPASGLTAVAQCKAALELVPVQPNAIEFLSNAIPFFHGPETAPPQAEGTVSKANVQADAPFSAAEFELAWRALCAFERNGVALQPTSEANIGLWRSLMSAAAVSGVKLTEVFEPSDLKDLLEEEGYDAEMLMAVLHRLATDDSVDGKIRIDRSRCASWLGSTILSSAGSAGMAENALRERWQELLPDPWEADAVMETINGHYKHVGFIIVSTDATVTEQAASTTKSEQARPKNKWHSRFAA